MTHDDDKIKHELRLENATLKGMLGKSLMMLSRMEFADDEWCVVCHCATCGHHLSNCELAAFIKKLKDTLG